MLRANPTQISIELAVSAHRRLRLAFLGGAYESAVGRVHRIAIDMDQRFELVAGCFSRTQSVNEASAVQYGVSLSRVYHSLSELLVSEKDNIDAIVILTPTDQHHEHVTHCLAVGIPVICEKALVTSLQQIASLRSQLTKTNGFLAVTYNYTGYPMLRELKAMVEQGRLGKIRQILVEMPQEGFARVGRDGKPIPPQSWRLHDEVVPTLSLDLGVHLHMMIRFLTGKRPLEVVANCQTFGNFPEVLDNISCLANYSDDIAGAIWYSKTALGCRNGLKVRIFGDEGAAEWIQERPEEMLLSDRHGVRVLFDRATGYATIANQARYTRFKAGHPAGFIEAFANYYFDVADSLWTYLNNDKISVNPYVFGIEESYEGMQMLKAIAESSTTKSWVACHD